MYICGVKVFFAVSEQLPRVMIDPSILRRVFTNLILNAIQAMPEGGELEIAISRECEDLLVAFKDTGVGIPEENMDKLFNPFFTTKAKGQGLGLAEGTQLLTSMRDTVPRMVKIIVTGYPSQENAVDAGNKGADGYVVKPIMDTDEFLQKIKKHLKNQDEAQRFSEKKVAEFIESRAKRE